MTDEEFMDGLPFREVVCHTEGCGNEGIVLTIPCAEYVVCGVCMQQITDVTTL